MSRAGILSPVLRPMLVPALAANVGAGYGAGSDALAFDFTRTTPPPGMTETCASGRYRTNSAGVLVPVAIDTTAQDYSAGLLRGALLEPQRTNVLPNSRLPGSSPWTAVALTFPTGIGPDGVADSASLLTETAAASSHNVTSPLVNHTSGLSYTISAILSAGTALTCGFGFSAGRFGLEAYANFDLANGVIGTAGTLITGHKITPVGSGWYLCQATAVASSTGTGGTIQISLTQSAASARNPSYTGTGRAIPAFSAQIEEAVGATSLMLPPIGTPAQVTRVANTQTFAVPNGTYARTVRCGTVLQAGTDYSDTVTVTGGTGHALTWATLPAAARTAFERHVQRVTLRRTG